MVGGFSGDDCGGGDGGGLRGDCGRWREYGVFGGHDLRMMGRQAETMPTLGSTELQIKGLVRPMVGL